MLRKNRKLIISIILVILVLLLITLTIFAKGKETEHVEENINEEELEAKFNEKFNNIGNEYVYTLYQIYEEETGKYKIEADIPYVHIADILNADKINNEINKEINDIFVTKLLQVVGTNHIYTRLTIDYAVSGNDDILSLIIRCTLKEGNSAQRTIIKTYNYNIQTLEKVSILDVIPEAKKENVQNKIYQKIEKQISKENSIISQGFNVYRRDAESDIYLLENATEFYIDNDVLYIIYSYGNNNYTSEIDLIIDKI